MKQWVNRILAITFMAALLAAGSSPAAEQAAAKKVAILPFQINAAQDLAYLREGILDMLASRLAWEGKVEVIEKQLVKEAVAGRQAPVNEDAARQVGKALGADYVLFGSLTVFGDSVSIDAKMVDLTGDKPPVTAFAQTKGMNEVIPRINDFAQDVNSKIFGRAPAVTAAQEQPKFSQANPEKLLVPGLIPGQAQGRTSELNPGFIVPSTVVQSSGFWQSQTVSLPVTSMAVADVNGDGIQEVILAGPREIEIFQRAETSLHLIKTYKGSNDEHFLWVSTADLNHNKIPEIYVSCRVREDLMSSFVLEWNGSDWVKIAEGIRWHLRAMRLPDKGEVLLGQDGRKEEPFSGSVVILSREGSDYRPLEGVPLPKGTNVYNFTVAPITDKGSRDVVYTDNQGRLKVTRSDGELLWLGDDRYAASFDYVPGGRRDLGPGGRDAGREKFFLNAPILIGDLNGDGRPEVIVNKNVSGVFGRDLLNLNFFGKSELYSFSWNGITMVENWHTPSFQGMTTAYEVADLNGDGRKELVVVLVTSPGTAIWEQGKSKVVVYPIAAPTSEKPEKG
jgi:TolB-like protein